MAENKKDGNLQKNTTVEDLKNLVRDEVLDEIKERYVVVEKDISWSKRTLALIINAALGKVLLKLLLILFGGALISTALFVTQVQEYELVMVHRWGRLLKTPAEPGLNWFVPWMDKVYRYDTRLSQVYIDGKEGNYSKIPVETRDKYLTDVIVSVHYRLNKDKGRAIVENFGSTDSKEARIKVEERIEDEIRYAVQNLCPQYELRYLIQNRSLLIDNCLYLLGFEKDPFSVQDSIVKVIPPPYEVIIPGPMPGERLAGIGIEINYIQIEFEPPPTYSAKRDLSTSLKEIEELAIRDSAEVRRLLYRLGALEEIPIELLFMDKWNGALPHSLVSDKGFIDMIKEDKVSKGF
ncbi:MAG: SPFH domain-containing protein [Bacteroidota bacterium]